MQGTDPRQLRTPARVLTVLAQPVLAEVVRLALSHGQFQTRIAADEAEATAMLAEWKPHLAIIDMDVSKGGLLERLNTASTPEGRIPVIALTRRGDLQTKLAAFDRGVDDILVVPFSPEELVARTLAIMRRTYRETIAFTPVIKLGELEVDILHRRVRAGSSELHLTARAELAVSTRGQRRQAGDSRADPRQPLGRRLRGREQCRRPSRPKSADETARQLAATTVHRDCSRAWLPLPPRAYASDDVTTPLLSLDGSSRYRTSRTPTFGPAGR